ncbi:hypothetical protein NX722_10310 [Endozoicomonas gorgoniicola]|uniref:Uncharacterized protein n=1 Tax=Endozoicomonas gorgoniicola TaxID=1234144 RepID=A0ABT3MUI8_9GAMM|nr:hypothetical protein [Endozoicomonas gorgoniicola]MCW7553024.1 hypothetical protein [Endozoicomonas gorgoniicola]
MHNSATGSSLSKEEFEKAFESHNLLLLKSSEQFTLASNIPGVSFTPANKTKSTVIKSYFSGYVFKADTRGPYDIFRNGFLVESPFDIGQTQGHGRSSISGGVVTSLSAIAAGYAMVHSHCIKIFVYLIDAMSYGGIVGEQPYLPRSYKCLLEPHHLNSCNVRFTHPIFDSDIIGCVWSDQFPSPQQAIWPPRVALAPSRLNLAVNPLYQGGMAKAEEVARLFSFD